MGLRSSPLAYTILPSSAGGLGLFQSKKSARYKHPFTAPSTDKSEPSTSSSVIVLEPSL